MKKIILIYIFFLFATQIYSFDIITKECFIPPKRQYSYGTIIDVGDSFFLYRTDQNESILFNYSNVNEPDLIPYDAGFLVNSSILTYYENNILYIPSTGIQISKEKVKELVGRSKRKSKNFSVLPLYGNNEIYEESDEYTSEFEYGFPVAYHNGVKYELPDPLNNVIGQMIDNYMFQSYDLFKLVTFVDAQYHEEKDFKPFICISDVIYDGSVTKETGVYEEPAYESKQVCKINKKSVFTVSKSANYEKETEYQDFWYYISGQDFSGWIRGETLLIEGDTWKDRLALRGEYFTEKDIK